MCDLTLISTSLHSVSAYSSVVGNSLSVNISDNVVNSSKISSDVSQVLSSCESTSSFNVALNESDVIKHLCNCNDVNLGWCFIHQKARSIEPYTQGTEFGFIPSNVIDIPLFRPPRILDIDNLDQWHLYL